MIFGGVLMFIVLLGIPQLRIAIHEVAIATGIFDSAPPEELNGPMISADALNFPMQTTEGDIIRLQDFSGNVVMMTYWASWCSTCRKTNPTIQTLKDELNRSDISFLLLSMDNVEENAVSYLDENRISLQNVFPRASLPSPLSGASIPTTYVIDKQGRVIYRNTGYANYSRTAFRDWITEVADR